MRMKQINQTVLLKRLLAGMLISVVTVLGMSAILAWMIDQRTIELSAVDIGAKNILFLSALLGAYFSSRGEKGVLQNTLFSAGYILILLGVHALYLDGSYDGLLPNAVIIIIATFSAQLLNKMPKRRKKGQRRKMNNR